jgi:transposase
MNQEKAEGLSPELQAALEPLLAAIESIRERIAEYNERIEKLAQQSYPPVAMLKQVKGVGTLIALTFLLTLEDPRRFRKSRDVGGYLGLQPGRRKSGQSEPQLHISKEGDPVPAHVTSARSATYPGTVRPRLRSAALGTEVSGTRRTKRQEASHRCDGKKRAIVATARSEPSLRQQESWQCCSITCG